MQRRTKAAIFDRCARGVRAAVNKGHVTPMQVESIGKGRKLLFVLIRDIASPKPKYREQVSKALQDVHPRTEYDNEGMLIHDLADVCVTLRRLEQGRKRPDEKKHTDAALLAEYLKEEFSAVTA